MADSFFALAALKSSAVLGAAWLGTLLLRRRSAAARHLVWTLAAAAIVILPVLSASLPAWRIPVAPQFLPGVVGVVFHAVVLGAAASSSSGTAAPAGGAALAGRLDWLMLLWAAGTALALAQMLAAGAAIRRAGRSAAPFQDGGLCAELAYSLGVRRPVQILMAAAGSMPMTFGFLRFVIFLPSDAGQWSEGRRRMVLLHELAHVRRSDVAMHWLARIAVSLYWWNPLAWVAWREFVRERERAADDLVLNAGARASDYAAHLLEMARAMRPAAVISRAAVAMARRSQLEGRLSAILDTGINRRPPAPLGRAVAALLAAATVIPLAALSAQDSAAQTAFAHRQAANRLISLGTAAILNKDFAQAMDYFERARQADPNDAGPALMWMAVVRERQNNIAGAYRLYQRALSAQDPKSRQTVTTLKLYSRFLREQDRLEEAEDIDARAIALQRTVAAHGTPPSADVFRVGPGLRAPKLLSKIEPSYSDEARAAKLAGTVRVYVEIGADGLAHNLRILQPLGLGLDDRALESIRQWRFQPGAKDGHAVTVSATVEINFQLL